jgi:hypothetical protein
VDWIRKSLGALFAALGVYYCALGGFTLLRLPAVTTQWIQQSGDPDFHYDYGFFMMLTALGAASVAVLGWRTVVQGVATARGRRASWLALAISALPLHSVWFLHRTIGAGLLDRPDQIVVQESAAIQFASVCVGYVLMLLLTRRPNLHQRTRARLQQTARVEGP